MPMKGIQQTIYVFVIQVDSKKRNISDLNINVTLDDNHALQSGPVQMKFRVFPHQLTNLYDYI